MDYISKKIGNRIVVWFISVNKYLFFEEPAFAVLVLFNGGLSESEIATWCSYKYHLPLKNADTFVSEIIQSISRISHSGTCKPKLPEQKEIKIPEKFVSVRHYKIRNRNISFHFGTSNLETLLQPIFKHLEIPRPNNNTVNLYLFENNDKLVLHNGTCLGCWEHHEFHLVKGKLFMEVLCRIYEKEEKDWLAVLHASAVHNGNYSLVFPGEPGCGKSTLAAILQKNNFKVLADDFVPIDTQDCRVFNLPTSISIKPSAIKTISTYYPELSKNYKRGNGNQEINLTPETDFISNNNGFPVKAIVFIRYQKNCKFEFQRITQDKALEMLIPDTWISPQKEHVNKLMNWITNTPCFQLNYFNNDLMIKKVEDLFLSEL